MGYIEAMLGGVDFSDIDEILETAKIQRKKIIEALDESHLDEDELELFTMQLESVDLNIQIIEKTKSIYAKYMD